MHTYQPTTNQHTHSPTSIGQVRLANEIIQEQYLEAIEAFAAVRAKVEAKVHKVTQAFLAGWAHTAVSNAAAQALANEATDQRTAEIHQYQRDFQAGHRAWEQVITSP
jgi:hypothetical protein